MVYRGVSEAEEMYISISKWHLLSYIRCELLCFALCEQRHRYHSELGVRYRRGGCV